MERFHDLFPHLWIIEWYRIGSQVCPGYFLELFDAAGQVA
jgi:hypothetical protein